MPVAYARYPGHRVACSGLCSRLRVDRTNQNILARARHGPSPAFPFVYQWSVRPTMAYATIAVFGATGWRAPNWMGLPVQWCGYDYAYALPCSPRWIRPSIGIQSRRAFSARRTNAIFLRGIRRLRTRLLRSRQPASQRPRHQPLRDCQLLLRLDNQFDSLAVASDGHRMVAPFPVSINGGVAHSPDAKASPIKLWLTGKE